MVLSSGSIRVRVKLQMDDFPFNRWTINAVIRNDQTLLFIGRALPVDYFWVLLSTVIMAAGSAVKYCAFNEFYV
jgi:hypothetical protein